MNSRNVLEYVHLAHRTAFLVDLQVPICVTITAHNLLHVNRIYFNQEALQSVGD